MIAYTGIETVSNLAEEARDPRADDPALDPARRGRRLRDLLHAAVRRALGAPGLPGRERRLRDEARPAAGPGRLRERPGARDRREPRPARRVLSAAKIYVGVLAATILFIATNAGVIGASRITYSMSTHRQLPERLPAAAPEVQDAVARRSSCSPGSSRSCSCCPGNVDFIGRMYAFGAMLSFTIAHAAVIQMRRKPPPIEAPYRVRPNLKIGRVDWPLFAVVGGIGTGLAWLVVVVQDAPTRYAGLALARRRASSSTTSTAGGSGVPMRETVLAPLHFGPAVALEYRRSSCRSSPGARPHEAIDLAARLAAERGATIVALRVIVVPLDLPIDARDARRGGRGRPAPRRGAPRRVGVRRADDRPHRQVAERGPRDRRGGRSAASRRSSSSARPRRRHRAIFGKTVDFVLKNAPCRVMVAAGKRAA